MSNKKSFLFYVLPSQSKLNMESLSKPELLMLFSILEGELEARDLVIEALKVPIIRAGNVLCYYKFSAQNVFLMWNIQTRGWKVAIQHSWFWQ